MTHYQVSVGTRCLFHALVTLAVFFMPYIAYSAILTPSEIVKLWIQVYPHDMKAAAALTTDKFRKGQSEQQWIKTHKHTLDGLELQYLGGNVISETIDENRAVVVFQAHISSLIGEQIQKEVYSLRKQLDGGWVIDAVKTEEDHPLGHDL